MRISDWSSDVCSSDLQRPVVAGGRHRAHEIRHWQVAFTRHVPEVPAPVQQVHVDARRIGELHDEDAVAWNRPDRLDVDSSRQGVEGIENEPDAGMFGAAHDLPGIAVVVDVSPRSEEHTSELQSLMRISYAVLCLK